VNNNVNVYCMTLVQAQQHMLVAQLKSAGQSNFANVLVKKLTANN